MLRYNEAEAIAKDIGALACRSKIEEIVDGICKEGYDNIFFIGVGGTLAYAWTMENIVKPASSIKIYVEHAADFNTMGNKNFGKKSVVIVESASGDTKEVVESVEKCHKAGAKVIGIIDKLGTPLAGSVDYLINSTGGGLYKWYAIMLRFMFNNGEFPAYDLFWSQMSNMPAALVEVVKKADEPAAEFAKKYCDEPFQYLIGAGNTWGVAYSYAMCLMEEMLWMKTKSITAGDFFHGCLEVVDRDTSVIVFCGEDGARAETDRVLAFVPRITRKLTVFDTADYDLPVNKEFRGLVSPMVMWAVCNRLTAHLEDELKHPSEIRRYYRQLKY